MDIEDKLDFEAMAQGMKAGKDEAFDQFWRYFGVRFRAMFRRSGMPPVDADDLAVSSITDIALKVEKYRKKKAGGFRAWVFQCAHNAMVSWWRKRRQKNLDDQPLQETLFISDSHKEYSEKNRDMILAVEESKKKLSPLECEILTLRYCRDKYNFKEIATLTGTTPSNARVKHHRALNKVKLLLESDPRIAPYIAGANNTKTHKEEL